MGHTNKKFPGHFCQRSSAATIIEHPSISDLAVFPTNAVGDLELKIWQKFTEAESVETCCARRYWAHKQKVPRPLLPEIICSDNNWTSVHLGLAVFPTNAVGDLKFGQIWKFDKNWRKSNHPQLAVHVGMGHTNKKFPGHFCQRSTTATKSQHPSISDLAVFPPNAGGDLKFGQFENWRKPNKPQLDVHVGIIRNSKNSTSVDFRSNAGGDLKFDKVKKTSPNTALGQTL